MSKKETFVMPFVDLSECTTLDDFTKAVGRALNIKDSFIDIEDLLQQIIGHNKEYDAFFFDNWENIQVSLKGQEWDLICDFIENIKVAGMKVLISSQEEPPVRWKGLRLPTLPSKDGRKLFKQLLERKGKKINKQNKQEMEAFNDLLENMENHPLTIVLTASLIEGNNDSLVRIQQRWSSVYDRTANQRHKSMKVALQMSYESIQKTEGAIELWGLIGMLNTDFPVQFVELLSEFEPDILWEEAEQKLYSRSLITHNAFDKIHMLSTVKLQWEKLVNEEEIKKCIRKWGAFLSYIVKKSDASHFTHNAKISNYLREPVLFCMPGFMKIVERLINENEVKIAEDCINAMCDYYELVGIKALTFLQNLSIHGMSDYTKGMVEKWIGDISRLGKRENPYVADKHYQKAITLLQNDKNAKAEVLNNIGQNYLWSYKDSQKSLEYFNQAENLILTSEAPSDKVMAMILKNKGIVLAERLNQADLAKECYNQAENLYKKIGDYRGIAHTTKRKAIIEWNKAHYEHAIKLFTKAINYYEDVHYIQGQADSMSRMCDAYIKLEDVCELKKLIIKGEKLMDVIPYQITKTDLVGAITRAKEWINEYNKEHDKTIDSNSPMKWIKHMVLCYFKLRDKKELRNTIHRFSIKNYEDCLASVEKELNEKSDSTYVIKMVYQKRFYKLPNYLISNELDLLQCRHQIQNSLTNQFSEIWYCANDSSDIRAYGRILMHLNELFPQRVSRKIEIVWDKSARVLEKYPDLSCTFVSVTTEGWGTKYKIDELITAKKSMQEIASTVDIILGILPKYYNDITDFGMYLRENGCLYLCLEFSFLNPDDFSFIDWDSDNDEKILRAFKNMQVDSVFVKDEA